MRADQARAYVESLLYGFVGGDRIVADHDGDYRVWFRNCLYFVRVIGHDVAVVQVFSVAVADVEVSPELLTELNTLNSEIQFARVYHLRQQILIETDVMAEVFDTETFENACSYVETVTLEMAPSLAARFGGRLTFANRLTLAAALPAEAPVVIEAPALIDPPVTTEAPELTREPTPTEVLTPAETPALSTTPVAAGKPEPAGEPEPVKAPAARKTRAPAKTRGPARKHVIQDVPTGQHL